MGASKEFSPQETRNIYYFYKHWEMVEIQLTSRTWRGRYYKTGRLEEELWCTKLWEWIKGMISLKTGPVFIVTLLFFIIFSKKMNIYIELSDMVGMDGGSQTQKCILTSYSQNQQQFTVTQKIPPFLPFIFPSIFIKRNNCSLLWHTQ